MVLFKTLLAVISLSGAFQVQAADSDVTLVLLNVLPFPDLFNRSFAGWDRAYELIPASDLATEQINNRTDILQGYRLEVTDVYSEPCGVNLINYGLVNTYRELVDDGKIVVGLTGLFCSSVTDIVAKVASRYGVDYIQVAGSSAEEHRDITAYPRLQHIVSSSNIFNSAALELLQVYNWSRVSIVHDSLGIVFINTAKEFLVELNRNPDLILVTGLQVFPFSIPELFTALQREKAKIIYAFVTEPEAAAILCEAFKRNFIWPTFVYIFPELHVADLLEMNPTDCTLQDMMQAIEGSFLLNYRFLVNKTANLVSALPYMDYRKAYLEQLHSLGNSDLDPNNGYANVAYDEIWLFALALNKSIPVLESLNMSLTDYRLLDKQSLLSDIIQDQLLNVSFQGASGHIKFGEKHETVTSVDIHQIQNATEVLIGIYEQNNITIFVDLNNIPSDSFERVYQYLPLSIVSVTLCVTILCYCFTTIVLMVFLYHRKAPEIKASTPYVSLLMFVGCYMAYTAVLSRTFTNGFPSSLSVFTFVCNFEVWCGFNGINLIYATLLVRLIRIHHIFNTFGKIGKFWSDKFIFLAALGICLIGDLILLFGTVAGSYYGQDSEQFLVDANPPYFEVTTTCVSDDLAALLIASFVFSYCIMALTVLVAVRTRHVKLSNFKDTKKTIAYTFISTVILAFGLPLAFILLYGARSRVGFHITLSLCFLLAGMVCLMFMFVPKVFLLLFCKSKRRKRLTKKESQFAMSETFSKMPVIF